VRQAQRGIVDSTARTIASATVGIVGVASGELGEPSIHDALVELFALHDADFASPS
jgi:hypothetical protein